MNTKTIKLLRIGALVVGWVLIAGVLAGIWRQLILYPHGQSDPMGIFGSMIARFDLAGALSSFFSGFGNAFFAFLIAAVFRMIQKQAPVGIENAQRLMVVCCLSYMADALTRVCSFVVRLSEDLQAFKSFGWRFWLPNTSTVVSELVPILYAASIFALYTHFTKMVTFESEVA